MHVLITPARIRMHVSAAPLLFFVLFFSTVTYSVCPGCGSDEDLSSGDASCSTSANNKKYCATCRSSIDELAQKLVQHMASLFPRLQPESPASQLINDLQQAVSQPCPQPPAITTASSNLEFFSSVFQFLGTSLEQFIQESHARQAQRLLNSQQLAALSIILPPILQWVGLPPVLYIGRIMASADISRAWYAQESPDQPFYDGEIFIRLVIGHLLWNILAENDEGNIQLSLEQKTILEILITGLSENAGYRLFPSGNQQHNAGEETESGIGDSDETSAEITLAFIRSALDSERDIIIGDNQDAAHTMAQTVQENDQGQGTTAFHIAESSQNLVDYVRVVYLNGSDQGNRQRQYVISSMRLAASFIVDARQLNFFFAYLLDQVVKLCKLIKQENARQIEEFRMAMARLHQYQQARQQARREWWNVRLHDPLSAAERACFIGGIVCGTKALWEYQDQGRISHSTLMAAGGLMLAWIALIIVNHKRLDL